MTAQASQNPLGGSINLPFLVFARVCTTAIFMTYPACLSVLLTEWQVSATRGGIVQGSFTAAFALSLLVASFLCDRVGAKRVFNIAPILSAVSAILFALLARSFETAVVLTSLMGLSQGGSYTPAIMLVSANTPQKKASAVGWVLWPAFFGLALDLGPATLAWGYAFSTLALGALVAILCALLLRRDGG